MRLFAQPSQPRERASRQAERRTKRRNARPDRPIRTRRWAETFCSGAGSDSGVRADGLGREARALDDGCGPWRERHRFFGKMDGRSIEMTEKTDK